MATVLCLGCAGCQTWGANAVHTDSKSAMVQLVADKATEHRVPVSLAQAVVKVESNFDERAYSQGNWGLGQIRCGTAKGIGFKGSCKALFDPEINLHYSMKYLRMALDKTKDDWCGAATLYNQGLNSSARNSAYCRKVLAKIPKQDLPSAKQAKK